MSEESFDQETEAKDEEDVESHGHKNLKNVEASDEPGNDESDDEARLLVGLEQRQVLGSAHLYGDGAQRIHDCGSKRHERQRRR